MQLPIVHKNGKELQTYPTDRKKTATSHKPHELAGIDYYDVDFFNDEGNKTENASQNAKIYEFSIENTTRKLKLL